MYRHLPHALIRTAALPVSDQIPAFPGPDADPAHLLGWLRTLWAQETFRGAVQNASPDLAAAVGTVLTATPAQDARTVRRIALSVARYHLRATTRSSPFGQLAGIGPARFTEATTEPTQVTHSAPRVRTRPDALWLDAKIAVLESDPEVIERCQVVVDSTARRHGDTLVLPNRPGSDGPTEARLHATPALTMILETASRPIPVMALLDAVQQQYPHVPRDVARNAIIGLVRERFLHTDARPPATASDPLAYLATHPAQTVRDVATAWTGDATTEGKSGAMTDLISGTSVTVSAKVAREVERALTVMARTSPHPHGTPAWRAYRSRFLEAYSLGTLVPLLDLIDPVKGIGLPDGYRGADEQDTSKDVTGRDEHLLALVQHAAVTGVPEIILTASDVEALAADPAGASQVPSNTAMNITVHAASATAIDEGRFRAVCGGLSVASGVTAGRFLPLLDPAERAERVEALAALPTLDRDAVRVQISGAALRARTQNVARTDQIVPDLIAVGEHNQDATIRLADLAVGATTSRMILVHLPTGRRIEPFVLNALEPVSATHPIVRFLYELPRAHTTVMAPFSWGAAGSLPFLPRVRTGRVVLSEAQWKLAVGDIDQNRTKGSGQVDPSYMLDVWLDRWGVPDHVFLGAYDRRLRLYLAEPGHRQMLLHEVRRQGRVTLTEAPELTDYGWIGHAHQLTVEFAAIQASATAPEPLAGPALVRRQDARQPGTARSCLLKIYTPADLMDTLLTDVLDADLARETRIQDWWFIRYRDPDDHLKLRLRLRDPDDFGAVARRMADWAAQARETGMVSRIRWDTDTPEIGRFGTGPALDAAEEFFVADSQAAGAQAASHADDLADQDQTGDLGESTWHAAVTVASMVDLARGLLGEAGGLDWILRRPRGEAAARPDRTMQLLASRLSGSAGPALKPQTQHGRRLVAAWERRRDALVKYAECLSAAGTDPAEVVGALLHMHHNRALGIDRDREAMILRAVRQTALTLTAAPASSSPGLAPDHDAASSADGPVPVHGSDVVLG